MLVKERFEEINSGKDNWPIRGMDEKLRRRECAGKVIGWRESVEVRGREEDSSAYGMNICTNNEYAFKVNYQY